MARRVKGVLLIAGGASLIIFLFTGAPSLLYNLSGQDPIATNSTGNKLLWFGALIVGIVVVLWGLGKLMSSGTSTSTSSSSPPRPLSTPSPKPSSPQLKQATSSASPLSSQNNKERAIAYCKEGQRLYDQERVKEALKAFNEALKYDASLLEAIEGKMISLGVLRENEQALGIAKRVLSLDPNSRAAWHCIAAVSFERGNKEVAWDAVNRLLSNDPKNSSALLIKAGLLEDDGRFREAIVVVNLVLEDAPNDEMLLEYRDALQQSVHKERVHNSVKIAGEIAANVGKMMAADILQPTCPNCGAKNDPGTKICQVCRKPRIFY